MIEKINQIMYNKDACIAGVPVSCGSLSTIPYLVLLVAAPSGTPNLILDSSRHILPYKNKKFKYKIGFLLINYYFYHNKLLYYRNPDTLYLHLNRLSLSVLILSNIFYQGYVCLS